MKSNYTQVRINKAPDKKLNDAGKSYGIGCLLIMLIFSIAVVSCSGEKERQRDTIEVLAHYNRAIDDYHRRAAELRMTFDRSLIVGYNMEQHLWESVRENHNLDSVEQAFLDKHGEHAFNELSLLISDNFDRKMRR